MLAACARVPVVSVNLATPPPSAAEMRELIAGRLTRVVVLSSPFASVAPSSLAERVAAAMPRLYDARYLAAPDPNVPAAYLLVWRFAGGQAGDKLAVSAALALASPGLPPLSEVHGHIEGITGPEDPAFTFFVEQMTLGVLWPGRDAEGSASPLQLFLFP